MGLSGGDTQQTTSTTQSASPVVTATTDKLLNGLQGQVDKGTAVFGQSLYPGISSTTQGGVNDLTNVSNNPSYTGALNGAIDEFGQIAQGNRFGMNDPGYATLRANAADDALKTTNNAFNASGRFGGGSNVVDANEGVTNAIAGLDYQNYQSDVARQQQALAALPQAYQGLMMPAQAKLQAGSILDANALATRQGDADLYDRVNNNGWNTYAKASSILAGTAGSAGQTTTNTSPATPWYQGLLGLAGQFA